MTATTLLTFLLFPTPDTQAIADLFDVLDKDGNGKVVAGELSDAQKPYFQRAIRVSDHNEDGALTREELTRALTEPERVKIDTSRGRGNFDPTVFDRNGDGYLSKQEIPSALQERFKRALEQFGDRIPVDAIRGMRSGQSPGNRSTDSKMPSMDRTKMMQAEGMSDNARRLSEAIKRFDSNRDGTLSARELRAAPSGLRNLDRNKDGEVSKAELAALNRLPEIRPGNSQMSRNGASRSGSTNQRPTAGNADQFFKRLDKNDDGKLTGEEIPQRMRQVARRVDRNQDRAISSEEFRRAVELQAGSR